MKLFNHLLAPALLIVSLSAAVPFANAAIPVVEDGLAKAEVVLSTVATPDEISAADELVQYVKKSTGVTLPLRMEHTYIWRSGSPVIAIGLTPAPEPVQERVKEMSGDGYVIETDGNVVYLAGKGRHGTSFAVYEFLERFVGVRWLWPGELGEVVPQRGSITVGDVSLARAPAFLWRGLGPGGALEGPFDRWTKARELGVSKEHQETMSLWERRNRFGGENIYGGHSFGEILPPSIYGSTHPEYYALVDGKRDNDWEHFDGKHRSQPCTTNPEVLNKVIEYCRLMFDRRPELDGVSIGLNDGRGFCECDQCRALDVGKTQQDEADPEMGDAARNRIITDRVMTFGNQVAEAVARTHPSKKLLIFAYSQFHAPPERVRTHPNLIVLYTVNSAGFWNETARKNAFRDFAAWSRMTPALGVYEYLTQQNSPDMPRLIPDLIRMELMELQRLGARYYQTQAGNGFANNGLNFYVLGRLLWDPSQDVDAIRRDYVNTAFGPAAPAMDQYYNRWIESWRSQKRSPAAMNSASLSDYRNVLSMYPPELREACRRDLDEALEMAGGDYKRRVEFVRDGFRYFELTINAAEATYPLLQAGWKLSQQIQAPADADWHQFALAADLWRQLDKYVDQHREDFVLSYMWVRSNAATRSFNPIRALNNMHRR